MGRKRYPEPFLRGKYFYFTYYEPKTGERKNKSTGLLKGEKEQAREYIRDFIDKLAFTDKTFREYAAPFFIWETCPRVARRLNEGKSMGKIWVSHCRRWLEKYIFKDPVFPHLKMNEIKRSHILDFRERLKKLTGLNTVNKVISTVKTILSEAYFREDITNNPGSRIGKINYEGQEKGILSKKELSCLFSEIPGVWEDLLTYCVFNLTAQTGLRLGEVLAITWQAVNFKESIIDIFQAWKTKDTLGLPKWNKTRILPTTRGVIESLSLLREESIRIKPEDLIFCYENSGIPAYLWPGENPLYNIGQRLGVTWWKKNFIKAMEKAGINFEERNITPHSLRHSLNTHLLTMNCDPVKVQAYFGWSSNIPILTRVQKKYTHFQAEHLRELVPVIEGIFQKD